MGSPDADVLLLNGVATIIKDLAEFAPIRALFRTHITRWRKKNALIVVNLRKAEEQLIAFGRRELKTKKPPKNDWPLRRIYPRDDLGYSELVPISPDLYRKVEKREDRIKNHRNHLLDALDGKRDWTPSECFTMLAEIHDARYPRFPIGPTGWRGFKEDGHADYVVDVDEATKKLVKGLSLVEAENLATVVERVLDRIEARPDSTPKNEAGKTLQQVIERRRRKLEKLVAHTRQHFVSQEDRDSVRHEVSKLRSDVIAMNETQQRRLAQQIQNETRRQQQWQTEVGGQGGKSEAEAAGVDAPQWDNNTEARNKWLYEQCKKGKKYSAIIADLKNKPKSWTRLEHPNSIKKAAEAYATRKQLQPIPRRSAGRPKQK